MAGAREPESLAQQLTPLYDGAGISARMDHDPTAATVAAILVDAALAS